MEQLRFTAVHEDGQHLVLSTADGTELLLPVDARLRAALRTRSAPADAPAAPLSPRNVQAMIRAGQSPEEVAEITGWPAERVARFEGPILAEREHVSSMAQAAHVRGRSPEGGVPTLGSRVLERLAERGVDIDNVGWDATRPEGGAWTVVVNFVAGQRQRAAAWHFEPVDRTVEALDDEARWLSEDEQALPGSATGGRRGSGSGGRAQGKPLLTSRSSAGEVELMTSMRERSRSRGRRKKASTSSSDPAGLPQLEHAPDDVLPLEDLAYDPETMGLPPAAHGESPAPEAAVEPAAAEEAVAVQGEAEGEEQGGYDVPLQFDNDAEDLDDAQDPEESEQASREATLDDLFGREDEADREDQEEDTTDDSEAVGSDAGHPDSGDSESGATVTGDPEADDDGAIELVEEPLEEDAAELGGDLDDLDEPVEAPDSIDAESSDAESSASPETEATEVEASTAKEAEGGKETEGGKDEPVKQAAKPNRRKDGRPGVPSWDDIMFGAKDRRN